MSVVKQLLLNVDARIGRFLPVRHIGYTRESILRDGRGAYSREEWTRARRAGYNQTGSDSQQLDSVTGFLSRAFGLERRKFASGLRLVDHLRPDDAAVLELGCGEMITSWAIKSRRPELRYHATDYDAFIVKKCRRLALLDPIEKSCVDIDEVDVEFLGAFQVIVAWDVFYAFEPARFVRFLEKVRAARSRLIVCSSQIVGPVRALSYFLKSALFAYARQADAGRLRAHGFKCSLGHYRQLGRQAGMSCRLLSPPPWSGDAGDCYFFIEFSPARVPVES